MYRIYKIFVYLPFLALWTVLNFLGVVVVAPFSARIASRVFGGIWGRGLMRAVPCRMSVFGLENIDPGTSYVVVANHLSVMDIPMLYGWLPLDLKWVMKKEVARIPVIGPGTAMLGHIFLDRTDHAAAVRQLQQLKDSLQPGTSILFFAEGTRSRSGNIQAFKMGAFHLACDLEVPVLPVTIRDSDRILPTGGMELRPGSAELVIHPAIGREEVLTSDPEALRDRAREIISSAL